MKVPYLLLSLGAAVLLLLQCYERFVSKQAFMHNINIDPSSIHDKKYGYFLQISDTHLDDHYTEGATLKSGCHHYPKNHSHAHHHELCGIMGVPGVRMDAPSVLLEHTLDWIKREWRDKLDFVIWTGDNSRHDWDSAHPRKEDKVLDLNRGVTHMMTKLFSSTAEHPRAIPVVPVIGNNDVQPHNYIKLHDDVLLFFEQLWDHWIPQDQRKQFLKGGYFAVDVDAGLRVLSINTMFFLQKNPLARACHKKKSSGHVHMNWYKQELDRARHDDVKVYVIGHVPPSPRDFYKSCLVEYMGITAGYSDVVYGHFYGHLNMDHFLLYDKREEELHSREEDDEDAFKVDRLPFLEDSIRHAPGNDDKIEIQRNVLEYVSWLREMYDDIDEFENKHPDRYPQHPIQGDSEPVVVIHIAPSVFPVYMPTVRIYRYEYEHKKEYGTLLGYSQYVANISRYNEEQAHQEPEPPLNYTMEYDTKQLYGLPDLSIHAYIEFTDMLTQEDPESKALWSTYCKNMFMQTLNSTFVNL